ncbi:MAG: recombinase family protein [Acidobacteriia bacterium]|nr:recombinase family protein [Terriglobia bacterium]
MRAAIYCRVSTSDQNCELQLRELREYVARRGWEIAGEYIDAGFSGSKASRPELDRLMKAARLRRMDTVIVWKLDRWGRSLAHTVQSIQELSSLGIRWIAITQNIDTDERNPMAQLLMHLMGAFAEFEKTLLIDRTRAGLRAARARGVTIGRPRLVFDRSQLIQLRNEAKLSWRAIGERLGISSVTAMNAYAEVVKKPPLAETLASHSERAGA